MAFPRAFALAEVLWTRPEHRDYDSFLHRLSQRLPLLDINYADHLFDIQFELEAGALRLSNRLGAPMQYQIGDAQAEKYTRPIPILQNARLRAWRSDGGGRPLELDFQTHAAFGKKVQWKEGPHPNYQLGGPQALANGLSGSDLRYGDGEWLGWWGKDVELTIDLEEARDISSFQTRFFQSQGEWIYLPREAQVFFSENGKDFTRIAAGDVPVSDARAMPFELSFEKKNARYWKIVVRRYGKIPDGRQGAGHEAWVFLDELRLK
jgi:hexosaminidase